MYDNNENYSQQTNNTGSSNNSYQEYYYSAGNPNDNYNQTFNAAPKKKSKKTGGFGKKAVSVVCLGLVFGVTAGAAFSVPAYMATRELKSAKLELQDMQSAYEEESAQKSTLYTTTDSLSAYNASYT